MSARTILMVLLGLIAGLAIGYFGMSFFFLDHVTNRSQISRISVL